MTPDLQLLVGGKGVMLARMYQAGYPVPEGFVILPSAFQGKKLSNNAWNDVLVHINDIKKRHEGAQFAV